MLTCLYQNGVDIEHFENKHSESSTAMNFLFCRKPTEIFQTVSMFKWPCWLWYNRYRIFPVEFFTVIKVDPTPKNGSHFTGFGFFPKMLNIDAILNKCEWFPLKRILLRLYQYLNCVNPLALINQNVMTLYHNGAILLI